MFKRFHDTEKWDKPWYRKLKPAEKCAWDFITSKCDNVGVWTPDFEMAGIYIGEAIDWIRFAENCNENIVIIDNGKWWLVDFCRFQYPELSEDSGSRPLLSYISLLKKHGLWKTYRYGINTVQDKDSYINTNIKSKKERIIREKEVYGAFANVHLSDPEVTKLIEKYGSAQFKTIVDKLSSYKEANGKKYKSDMGAITQWVIDAVKPVPLPPPPPVCKLCGSVLIDGVCHNVKCEQYT